MFNVQYSMFNVFYTFVPMKERNHAFDLLCGLCILRMIVLHCVSMCGFRGCTFWFDKLMAWTFFFICFFFFKAGYFNKSISAPTKFFLKDKFKRLFISFILAYCCCSPMSYTDTGISWSGATSGCRVISTVIRPCGSCSPSSVCM